MSGEGIIYRGQRCWRARGGGDWGRVIIPREPLEVGVGEGHNTRILGAVLQVLRL